MGSQLLHSALLLVVFFILPCFQTMSFGAEESRKLYIVYMGEKQHEDPNLVTASHHDMLTSLLGSKEKALNSIVYSYKHGFSGFAAWLTKSQANKISDFPGVLSVMPNRKHRVHTTRSWDFLGLNYYHPTATGLLHKANYGENVIIGVIDSGIWPESKSFNDHGFGPVPSRWKGKCEVGQLFDAKHCNKKLIGARWYNEGADAEQLKGEYMSPRDLDGHGTHTASTAAGILVENVSFHGLAAGAARGGAPRARLAIYKACWGTPPSCSVAAVLAAMDDAIHDGVNVLSLSVGGSFETPESLHAVANGITVVFSGGNDGPYFQTVDHPSPWVITVAASTIDRSFPTVITLGNNQKLVGQSRYRGAKKDDNFRELVWGSGCTAHAINAVGVAGKIVLCFDPKSLTTFMSPSSIDDAIGDVKEGRGKGIILGMHTTNALDAFASFEGFPAAAVDYEMAFRMYEYIDQARRKNMTPSVKIAPTQSTIGNVVAPKIAAFSSRGPSTTFPEVLKPDIAAPGVNVLAAMGYQYKFDSGTSMACPHVSGVVALLKSLHPNWSPAAIKSALVTTASVTNEYGTPITAEGVLRKAADPFDFGGGHINPNRAADPGLIYDFNPKDYVKFFDSSLSRTEYCNAKRIPLYHINLPSIAIPNLRTSLTTWRTVTNVAQVYARYKAIIESPPGVKMVVEPSSLIFDATTKMRTFKVTFTSTYKKQGDYTFGSLTWNDGGTHSVRIPIAVRVIIEDFYADTA
ncbi:subtilisin-like protease SBT3.9 isoform X4 [Elaeis guineensis]|uniref:subtilisin-like protease SBT3.9 isoform X3 n=1 Tax=Elaeis guineensis var. tenera TaxID=51953 RepID=UPI003C6D7FFF